ncbi:MAG: RND family transporter [Actinobacteria bacterium]|nr:MAG: RND family transporter [Actinomycetota bacterium]
MPGRVGRQLSIRDSESVVKPIIRFFANAVGARPWVVIGVTVALSIVFALLTIFVSESSIGGQEGFSPDNEEIQAIERIGELFGEESNQVVMQVVVTSEAGDVVTAEGLSAANRVVADLQASEYSDDISGNEQQPGVVTFMAPVQQASAEQGIDTSGFDDTAVKQLYSQALSQAGDQLGFVDQLVSEDGSAGLILVFVDTADDADTQIEREEGIAEIVRGAATGDDIELRPFSFNLLFTEDAGFEEEIGRLFGSAFLIIIGILLFVFWLKPRGENAKVRGSVRRTLADMSLTMLTIVFAIFWMNGIGALLQQLGWIGAFNEISQIVPVLLIGLGVDYGIHLTSRYREEVGESKPVDGGIRAAIGTVGVALALATVTTMIGFLTNVVSPIPALKDFGILAAVGIGASFILMLTFVPAVREILDRRAESRGELPREAMGATSERLLPQLMEKTAVLAERAPIFTLIVVGGLGFLGYLGLSNISTEFSFTDFLPDDSPTVETFEILEAEFGGGFGETTQVLIEGDVADPDVFNAIAGSTANMADTENVLTFQTPFGEQPAVASPVSVVRQLLAPGADGVPANPEFAQFAVQNGLNPEDGTMSPSADVAAIYEAAGEIAPAQLDAVLHYEDGEATAALMEISTQAGENEALDLRDALVEDTEPLAAAGVTAIPTSQNIIGGVVVDSLSSSQVTSLIITLVAATIVLVINFWFENRRPFLGVITIAPVALVVLWTFGLMYLSGIPFGPVTATLTGLAVGIGVPYTIHMARRFEEDRSRYDDIDAAIRSTTRHTGGALAGSAFTTAAGFGILITSTLTPFRQMGQVTAYAILLSLVGAVLVLPSMLVLWEGWHRRHGDAGTETPTTSVV